YGPTRDLPSFPTRRSSDLLRGVLRACAAELPAREPEQGRGAAYGGSRDPRRSAPGDGMSEVATTPVTTVPVDERSLSGVREAARSEEHTSELQSLAYLVCR